MTLRFGTDGVRGLANAELTPELVLALGRAAARVLGGSRFVVGRDTRRSGGLIEGALTAGMTAEGASVERLGVVPTPGVAWVCADRALPGAVISASHNPFGDNGVKLFAVGGRKLDDATEADLEAELDRLLAGGERGTPSGPGVGVVGDRPDEVSRYLAALVSSVEGVSLEGMAVVVDCAHGAASGVAPEVLRRLPIDVTVLNAEPNGENINAGCGSTHPENMQEAVRDLGADAGLAFDGDADRVIAADHQGRLVDGDQIIAVLARDLRARGSLAGDTVVVTVMSNLGFRRAMDADGITMVETPVGDRHVLQAMEEGGWSLGGEQSGHIILRQQATTGDGILTGLQLLAAMARSGRSLADLTADVVRFPQVLRNVPVAQRPDDIGERLARDVAAIEASLGGEGRVLIRPSGTEAVVRVMVEAATEERAASAADRLAVVVERACR